MSDIIIPSLKELASNYPKNPYLAGPYYEMESGPYQGHCIMDIFEHKAASSYIFSIEKSKAPYMNRAKESVRIIEALRFQWYCENHPLKDVKDHEVQFGKYEGNKVSTIFKKKYNYCEWIMKNFPNKSSLYEDWHKMQVFLREKYDMGHSAETLKSIKEISDAYLSKKIQDHESDDEEIKERPKPKTQPVESDSSDEETEKKVKKHKKSKDKKHEH